MVRLPEKGENESRGEAPSLTALSQEVKELVRLISATDIQELHLESGEVRIVIKRGGQVSAYSSPVYTPPSALPTPEASSPINLIGHSPAHGAHGGEIALGVGEQFIVAPMLGTFYAAPSPDSDPFVAEGDMVEPGQSVGIIEAMKMMNEIESDVGGRITRVLVQNAEPVEYGQPLMVVETDT